MSRIVIKRGQPTPTREGATLPPTDEHWWHWLTAERSSMPAISEWMNGYWHGPDGNISPEEMWKRGWEWHARVKMPKDLAAKMMQW